jgi:hypothetical protein
MVFSLDRHGYQHLEPLIHINRFLEEHNQQSKPFSWTADPDKIIAAVRRRERPGQASELAIAS